MDKHGRLLIPSIIRNNLNYKAGDSFVIRMINDELRIISIKEAVKSIQNMVQKHHKESLVDEFIKTRRSEAENENLKFDKNAH